jgi:hypothetical protein
LRQRKWQTPLLVHQVSLDLICSASVLDLPHRCDAHYRRSATTEDASGWVSQTVCLVVTDQICLPLRFKTELILSLSLNIRDAHSENQAVPPTSCLAGLTN